LERTAEVSNKPLPVSSETEQLHTILKPALLREGRATTVCYVTKC